MIIGRLILRKQDNCYVGRSGVELCCGETIERLGVFFYLPVNCYPKVLHFVLHDRLGADLLRIRIKDKCLYVRDGKAKNVYLVGIGCYGLRKVLARSLKGRRVVYLGVEYET